MSTPQSQPAQDPASLAPPRRIVLVAGPSGSGKGVLATRSGLPMVPLDEFYRDLDDPNLPRRFGIVDWDVPASWDADAAFTALSELARTGTAQIPTYSISQSRRVGTRRIEVGDAPLIIAEGIFAAELIAPLASAGLLADAIVLKRPVPLVFVLRLARDLREARKPVGVLLRRGLALAAEQPQQICRWARAGMTPMPLRRAIRHARSLAQLAWAERHHRQISSARTTLRITAVCFLRTGEHGPELLGVRKRGTSTYIQVGGKLEAGESAQEAALRETVEETGLHLDVSELELLGDFHAVAANEPDTLVHSTVFLTHHPLPEDFQVQAELAEHRWFPLTQPTQSARVQIAPLMAEHIIPALRRRLGR